MDSKNEGVKHDQGKLPYHLIPWDAVDEIAKVLQFGATKYDARNWEKGMNYSRLFGAICRHITAWFMGETYDPETGLNHLAHAGCGIFFLLAYSCRGMGQFDDRPACNNKEAYGAMVDQAIRKLGDDDESSTFGSPEKMS